jgi:sulfur relay (sulfurtransferase) complex TusBCD TusD component (DsrE family)
MASYLLIESRDPFEFQDVQRTFDLAASLAKNAENVTVFLVENGVFSARESSASQALVALAAQGVTILADAFSLKERGIHQTRLARPIASATVEDVVDALARDVRVLWH